MRETNKKSNLKLLFASLGMGFLLASICLYFQSPIARAESQIQIIEDIRAKEAHALILKNKDNQTLVILDVRTPEEFAGGHLENAVNLDYHSKTFEDTLNELDRNKTYLVYCQVGVRSGRALRLMKKIGFREAYNLAGGIVYWGEAGFPITE